MNRGTKKGRMIHVDQQDINARRGGGGSKSVTGC